MKICFKRFTGMPKLKIRSLTHILLFHSIVILIGLIRSNDLQSAVNWSIEWFVKFKNHLHKTRHTYQLKPTGIEKNLYKTTFSDQIYLSKHHYEINVCRPRD